MGACAISSPKDAQGRAPDRERVRFEEQEERQQRGSTAASAPIGIGGAGRPVIISDDARLLSRSTDQRQQQRELFTQLIARADKTFISINAAPDGAGDEFGAAAPASLSASLWTDSDAALVELNRRAEGGFAERLLACLEETSAGGEAGVPPLPAAEGDATRAVSYNASSAPDDAAAAVLAAVKEKLVAFEERAASRQFTLQFD